MNLCFTTYKLVLAFTACIVLYPNLSLAFIINPSFIPWTTTASGDRAGNGVAGTLTWSFVPDGTPLSDGETTLPDSDLIAYLNAEFEGDEEISDHTQQPWFSLFEQSFQRWADVSGLTFVYEPNDDGGDHTEKMGELGVRGDIRIAGTSIDDLGGTLAFNFIPEFGSDMVLDTDETSFARRSSREHRFFRNTLMHELGHGFGLSHVESDTDRLLMEPFTDTAIDGPQLDEVRGIQYYFGDRFEAIHDGAGNGTVSNAADIGMLTVGETLVVGADGNADSQAVSETATDFVSISNHNDLDFFSFTVAHHGFLNAELTPLGGTFNQASESVVPTEFDANSRSDLTLTIIDLENDIDMGFADNEFEGIAEVLESLPITPGEYVARIEGLEEDAIQLYMLNLQLVGIAGDCNGDGILDAADLDCACGSDVSLILAELGSNPADLDANGRVEFDDFLTFSRHFGRPGTYRDGDLDCDGHVGFPDFLTLAREFGETEAAAASVPEPTDLIWLMTTMLCFSVFGRSRV